MEKWQIEKAAGRCVKTDALIGEGEAYYAVLYEEGEGFRREEYCLAAWEGEPEGAFCYFKTRMPVKEKKKRLLVDDDMLVNFFRRLKDETLLLRLQFRFVLALILMRKRLLKYEETKIVDEQEFWVMRLSKETETHSVLNPRLTDSEIEAVSKELGAILHGDVAVLDQADAGEGRHEDTEARRDEGVEV